MILILTTDTTTQAIDIYNNMLTGGNYDVSYMPWTPYSGYSIIKRDDNNPNKLITDDNTPGMVLLAGSLNSGLTNSHYTTIYAGTGNTVDYFNNKILAGENNSFKFVPDFSISTSDAANFEGSSIIMGGKENYMSGTTFLPGSSVIMNGSGNSIINSFEGNGNPLLTDAVNLSDNFKRNTIINGISNSISGTVGNSWIGNGSGNTIYTTGVGFTKGNFILNGHDNKISSSLSNDNTNYNTIIGGYNNTISDKNNSIIVGSNLQGITDTTSVNRMFYDKKMMFNDYELVIATTLNSYIGAGGYHVVLNPNNKSVGIIEHRIDATITIFVDLNSGTYLGQTIYLIGIPNFRSNGNPSGDLSPIGLNTTVLGGNIISYDIYLTNVMNGLTSVDEAKTYTGLGIFVWDGTYWIRADHRGGI